MNINNPISMPYLPTSRMFPVEQDKLIQVLSKTYLETAQAVNRRTIGIYNKFQSVTGNQWYSTTTASNQNIAPRQSYRRVYTFGAIVAGAAALEIPHELTNLVQFVFIGGNCITAASVNPNGKYLPIPYTSAADVTEQIQIYVSDTSIFIVNGAGADNIISGTVVLEYLLQ
jgi:hypothetical protein